MQNFSVSNRKNLFLISLFSISMFIISCTAAPEGDATLGKRWYNMHCYNCHGQNGNDGRSPDITGLNMSYRAFLKRLRKDNSVTMPEYTKEEIPDKDAADILAYINTLK